MIHLRKPLACLLFLICASALAAQNQPQPQTLESFINTVPDATHLRGWHDLLGSEPHMAGTPGDERNIALQIKAFHDMGLDVTAHEFWAYLSHPVEAAVEIISPDRMSLLVKEAALAEDAFSAQPDLTIGFNAYSADGDVTGEVVYANHGTKADFDKLRELGIDCTSKIVLARYGKNFRGYKARFAQEAGAAGLIIYTDPDDSGYRQGVPYPEGGWANETYIQRGSINTLPYSGDPLTPGIPATEDAKRLDPKEVDLPRIPVQPIGYGAAREIMSRMKGTPLPQDLVKTWQGGLPFAYRLTGGTDLRVRVKVKQDRAIRKTANVVATLPGQTHPDQKVIIGCHHDAWGHGAGDPLSGTILVFEAARSFAEAAKKGLRPDRTIVFATWGAEEFGILGSSEYCEQFADDLSENAVAYINLDAASMGTQFGASSSPSLKRIIDEIAALVPQAQATDGTTVRKAWLGDRDEPDFGNLGGGSDHIGFYCHLGIPSCGLGADGAPGTAYHSIYDNLHWYRQVVGDDYEPALMLTRAVNLLATRLADAPIIPLDPARYAVDIRGHLEALTKRAGELGVAFDVESLNDNLTALEAAASKVSEQLRSVDATQLSASQLAAINSELRSMERVWLFKVGLPERPWFKSLYASSDPDSGYAAWMLPGLRWAIEQKDPQAVERWLTAYAGVIDSLTQRMAAIETALRTEPGQSP